MTATSISKKEFNEYVREHFIGISKTAININVYTLLRCIVIACETYSYKRSKLYSGGIYHLTINSIKDTITDLLTHRLINNELHNNLLIEYHRDKDTAIPEALCELIFLLRRNSKSNESRKSSCCNLM